MVDQNTLADLSSTAALNLNIKGQSQQGTAPANTIDSIFQKYGASLHDFYNSIGGVATVSGTDTYTVTITEDWAALTSGLILAIKVPNANTGAATLNVTVPTAGALGAKAIRRQGDSALSANDMLANGIYLLRYASSYNSSAGAWVLLNAAATIAVPLPEASGGTNQTTYTQGDLLYASAANTLSKLAKGSTGQVLGQTSTIPAWGSAVTLGSPTATTSGTSIDFTGIPSWVRKITLSLSGVSTNGTSVPILQLGDAGGVETSGYLGGATVINSATPSSSNPTTGFAIQSGNAANVLYGTINLTLIDGGANTWAASGVGGLSNLAGTWMCGGNKSTSATLDRVRLTATNGTDAFDAGTINITYE